MNHNIDVILRNTVTLDYLLLPDQQQPYTAAITLMKDEIVTLQTPFQVFCLCFCQMCLIQKQHIQFLTLLDF
jgi:hypothetical protein